MMSSSVHILFIQSVFLVYHFIKSFFIQGRLDLVLDFLFLLSGVYLSSKSVKISMNLSYA